MGRANLDEFEFKIDKLKKRVKALEKENTFLLDYLIEITDLMKNSHIFSYGTDKSILSIMEKDLAKVIEQRQQ